MSRFTIAQALTIGLEHHQAGRLTQAESVYRQIIAQEPRNAEAHHLLGVVAHQCGQLTAAIELIEKAVELDPANATAYTNLGESYRQSRQLELAEKALRRAIKLNPKSAEALGNLGLVCFEQNRASEAIPLYYKALAIRPSFAQTESNLGNALLRGGDLHGGLAAYDRALAIDPNFADGHNNRGSALEYLDRLDEAFAEYLRAAELRPTFAIACNNAGNVARRLCRWDDALLWCNRALQLEPAFEPARWNIGLIELTRGDYAAGLPKYELRFVGTPQRLPPEIQAPRWDGSPLEGKTILICGEQGLGDGFQAARFLPMVAARGGKIVIYCHKQALGLMRTLEGVTAAADSLGDLPHYDLFVPNMSLALLAGTTLSTIPRVVPYLFPDAKLVQTWRDRLAPYPGLKVGLVWHGSDVPDPTRSMKLSELAPLGAIPGVQFFGLQVGPAAVEAKKAAAWMNIIDLSDDVEDFTQTASCMMNLDLVLTVDTAAAHLAGALGRPTWTLLPVSPDWRWLLDREDSPWYPTMRLFRQTERKNWTDVVARIKTALTELAAAHPTS